MTENQVEVVKTICITLVVLAFIISIAAGIFFYNYNVAKKYIESGYSKVPYKATHWSKTNGN